MFLERWGVAGWPNTKIPVSSLSVKKSELGQLLEIAGKLNEAIQGIESASAVDRETDVDALYDQLVREGKATTAKLVQFMKGRGTATFEDMFENDFGMRVEEGSVRSRISRANTDIRGLKGLRSRLRFETQKAEILWRIDQA